MRFESIVEEEGWALLSRRPLRDFLEEEGGGGGWWSGVGGGGGGCGLVSVWGWFVGGGGGGFFGRRVLCVMLRLVLMGFPSCERRRRRRHILEYCHRGLAERGFAVYFFSRNA